MIQSVDIIRIILISIYICCIINEQNAGREQLLSMMNNPKDSCSYMLKNRGGQLLIHTKLSSSSDRNSTFYFAQAQYSYTPEPQNKLSNAKFVKLVESQLRDRNLTSNKQIQLKQQQYYNLHFKFYQVLLCQKQSSLRQLQISMKYKIQELLIGKDVSTWLNVGGPISPFSFQITARSGLKDVTILSKENGLISLNQTQDSIVLQIVAVSISEEGSGINFRRYGWNKILSKYKEFSIEMIHHNTRRSVIPQSFEGMADKKLFSFSTENPFSFASWTKLQEISLSDCNIGNIGCQYLCKVHWPQLKKIDLSGNSIIEEGYIYLIRSVWKKLKILRLFSVDHSSNKNRINLSAFKILCKGDWPQIYYLSTEHKILQFDQDNKRAIFFLKKAIFNNRFKHNDSYN